MSVAPLTEDDIKKLLHSELKSLSGNSVLNLIVFKLRLGNVSGLDSSSYSQALNDALNSLHESRLIRLEQLGSGDFAIHRGLHFDSWQ